VSGFTTRRRKGCADFADAIERFLPSDDDLSQCASKLQESPLFAAHADYVCRQFVHCLIEVRQNKS
jgi:hypothetical protein